MRRGEWYIKDTGDFIEKMQAVEEPQNISLKLKEFAKRVAEKCTSTVTSILRGAANASDVGACVDRSWQPKGFKSLNKVITAKSIDSEKSLILQFYTKVVKDIPKCRRQRQQIRKRATNGMQLTSVV